MPPKKDPANYMFRKMEGQLLVKPPGSLNGNGFLMDHLVNCEVYILDHTSQITIDDCTDCKIFIGPCDGSVFIRDCARLTMAVATRQLRTRDCRDLDISLLCATNPSIETSSGVVFSRWCGAYEELGAHFAAARLDPGANTWDQVYDFNAGEEVGGTTSHWATSHDPRPEWRAPPADAATDMPTAATTPTPAPAGTPTPVLAEPAPSQAPAPAPAPESPPTQPQPEPAPAARARPLQQPGPAQWDGGIDLGEEDEDDGDEGVVGREEQRSGDALGSPAPAPEPAAAAVAAEPAAGAEAAPPAAMGPRMGALVAAVAGGSGAGGSDARDVWRAGERERRVAAAAAEADAKAAARAAGQRLLEQRAAARKARVAARRAAPGRGRSISPEAAAAPAPTPPGAPPAWSAVTALLPTSVAAERGPRAKDTTRMRQLLTSLAQDE